MTDKHDNADEEQPIPGIASFSKESMDDSGDDDNYEDDDELLDEEESDDFDSLSDELTPNDIFGLDPLDVLTLEELADYLKVSIGAVKRAVKEQQLPGRNIGGDWRFLRDAVANWLRGQQASAQQQQQARSDYTSYKSSESEGNQYSQGNQQSYESEDSGGDYRSRRRYSEGGNQGGGQYGNRGGQYSGEGQYGGGTGYGERRPRRPYRSNEGGGGYGSYGGGQGGGYGGQGNQYGGGSGYSGGQRYGGGPKRRNKRQVFDNERGKRLDRRKENDAGSEE